MTGPDDDSLAATRPISVAELLARNGTAGAPSAGGRRRLRRGDTTAVTVAELTGEIPIITDDTTEEDVRSASGNGTVEPVPAPEPPSPPADDAADAETEAAAQAKDAEAEYDDHIEARETQPDPVEFQPPRRSRFSHVLRPSQRAQKAQNAQKSQPKKPTETVPAPAPTQPAAEGAAEAMSPDPVIDEDDDVADSAGDLVEPTDDALFGGATDTDDSPRRGVPGPEDIDLDEDAEEDLEQETDEAPPSTMSTVVHGAWIVGQSVIAVLFGAGLFIAFDQLWKWNVIVAMVLAVLVILGLVAGVRVVRKTEDIGTTLITIVVGALVTFGPLALQSV